MVSAAAGLKAAAVAAFLKFRFVEFVVEGDVFQSVLTEHAGEGFPEDGLVAFPAVIGDHSTGAAPDGLDQHLRVVAIKAPFWLPDGSGSP